MDTRTGAWAQSARFVSHACVLQATGAFDGADLEQPDAGTVYVTLQYDNEKVEDEAWHDLQLHWGQGKESLQSRNEALRVKHVSNAFLQLLRDAEALQELPQQQVGVKRERGMAGWTSVTSENMITHRS